MTTVNLSGTWSEKQRPNNGLERLAGTIHRNRILRVPVVGYVEFHAYTEKLTGDVLTVAVPVIEPTLADDGTDPDGRGKTVMDLIDQLRKERGVGSVDDVPSHSGELAGQEGFDFDGLGDGGEGGTRDDEPVDTNASGEPVPPPSGEEIQAERAEAKARGKKEAPAAEFSGGAE